MSLPFEIDARRASEAAPDLWILGIHQGESADFGRLPRPVSEAGLALAGTAGWDGRSGQQRTERLDTGWISLHGLGERKNGFDACQQLLAWAESALSAAANDGHASVVVAPPPGEALQGAAAGERLARRLLLARYRFEQFRKPDDGSRLSVVRLAGPRDDGDFAAGVRRGRIVSQAVWTARDLANTPPNVATPEWMSRRCQELAEQWGYRCTVLDETELGRRQMGGLLAVGGGSSHPPRLVRLERQRPGPVVALVGKGVTFDTGGISIKPAANMEEMKYDKCGACTALGVAQAVSELDLPLTLRVYLPFAENMPDGAAYRPGDIIRPYQGKTVEIVNTDAEGRLILADALSWAAAEEAELVVELSTLTGACVVALGQLAAGLYTPNDELSTELLEAASQTAERLWRMPLWSEFGELLKSTHADLKNIGGRWGGANSAAAFLANFVHDHQRWAHLDIAGPAYVGGDGKGAKGATGYGIAFLAHWLTDLAHRRAPGKDS